MRAGTFLDLKVASLVDEIQQGHVRFVCPSGFVALGNNALGQTEFAGVILLFHDAHKKGTELAFRAFYKIRRIYGKAVSIALLLGAWFVSPIKASTSGHSTTLKPISARKAPQPGTVGAVGRYQDQRLRMIANVTSQFSSDRPPFWPHLAPSLAMDRLGTADE